MHNLLLQDFKFALWTGIQSQRPKLEHSGRGLHHLLLRQWRHHQQCRPSTLHAASSEMRIPSCWTLIALAAWSSTPPATESLAESACICRVMAALTTGNSEVGNLLHGEYYIQIDLACMPWLSASSAWQSFKNQMCCKILDMISVHANWGMLSKCMQKINAPNSSACLVQKATLNDHLVLHRLLYTRWFPRAQCALQEMLSPSTWTWCLAMGSEDCFSRNEIDCVCSSCSCSMSTVLCFKRTSGNAELLIGCLPPLTTYAIFLPWIVDFWLLYWTHWTRTKCDFCSAVLCRHTN